MGRIIDLGTSSLRMTARRSAAALSATLFALTGSPASGQDALTPDIVQQRPYGAKGVAAGTFRAYPVVYGGLFYDDNVYRTQAGTVSDVIYTAGVALGLRSDWGRHMLNLNAAVDNFTYAEQSSENRTQWNIGADGRLDILHDVTLTGDASYAALFESRNSPNEIGFAAEPTAYSLAHFASVLRYQPSRLGAELGVSYDRFEFNNTALVGGGVADNSDRDHQRVTAHARASYDMSPGRSLFLRASYDTRDYQSDVDRFGLRRDSDGFAVDVGMNLMVSRLVEGEIFIGYIDQNFVAPLPDVSGLNYGGSLTWTPSRTVTVQLSASRQLSPTILIGAAASDERRFGVILDYEFLRNFLVRATLDYVESTFPGTDRDDQLFAAGLGLRYLINDYLTAEARYEYSRRNSSIAGEDFKANSIFANLRLHL